MVGALSAMNKERALDDSLFELKGTLSGAMDSIRKSVHNLHDDSIDLKEEVNKLVKDFAFCTVELEYDLGSHVAREVRICFLAIIKEACSNIIKHSRATKVNLVLREHPVMYQLLIQDNGVGVTASQGDGIGLSNMEDRVRTLQGTITITKDSGYRIFIMIPKKEDRRIS